jgi:SulP family sulfate permease
VWPARRRRREGHEDAANRTVTGGLRGYDRRWLRGDVLAGVTVAAYAIPQVMAYADLATVPVTAGLWAFVGSTVVYALLGSSRQLSVGPESTTALMTAAALGSAAASGIAVGEAVVALAMLTAGFCLVGWLLRLGALADLLSRPVLVGYLTGIAGIMIVSQLDELLGLAEPDGSVLGRLGDVITGLPDAQVPTAVLGLVTLLLMLVASRVSSRLPVVLLGILAATATATLLGLPERGVEVVGEVPSGLPSPGLPVMDGHALRALMLPALGIAFVGFTDNLLTARAFAARRQEKIDPQRELLALAGANLGAAALHGMPVSSSGSRTALVDAVGGRSQLAGVVAVVCTLVALGTLTPVLAAFPLTALAAVVVYAATRLVDARELRRFARFRRSELVLALVTAAGVLVLDVLQGIVLAIALSGLDLLRRVAHPHDAVEGLVPELEGMHDVDDYPDAEVIPGLMVYRYDSPLFFANAEDFRRRALAAVEGAAVPVRWFVLNVEANTEIDVTAADALESLHHELDRRGVVVALARLKQDLRAQLARTPLLERIGEEHIFPTLPTAVAAYLAAGGATGRRRSSQQDRGDGEVKEQGQEVLDDGGQRTAAEGGIASPPRHGQRQDERDHGGDSAGRHERDAHGEGQSC